jgi:hypothetical protein
MLQSKGMPNSIWVEAVATTVYILNLSPTKAIMNKTPYEAWFERKLTVSHLQVFGCVTYTLINLHNRRKLDAKYEKCIFIGYCIQSKGYRLYNPETKKIIVSRNVMFDENTSWRWNSKGVEVTMILQNEEDEDSEQSQSEMDNEQPQFEANTNDDIPTLLRVYTRRGNQSQQKAKTLQELYSTTQALLVADPECFEEAARKEEWVTTMKKEIRAIEENNT